MNEKIYSVSSITRRSSSVALKINLSAYSSILNMWMKITKEDVHENVYPKFDTCLHKRQHLNSSKGFM